MDETKQKITAIFGMIDDIHHLLEQTPPRAGAAVVLMMASIDAMAHLGRPHGQEEGTRIDFKSWTAQYLKLEASTITPDEWYDARNALLHTYGSTARLSKTGKARRFIWTLGSYQAFKETTAQGEVFLTVNLDALHRALHSGVKQFLADCFSDPTRAAIIEPRLGELILQFNPCAGVIHVLKN